MDLHNRVWHKAVNQIRIRVLDHIWEQVVNHIRTKVEYQIGDQVENNVDIENQVRVKLIKYEFKK